MEEPGKSQSTADAERLLIERARSAAAVVTTRWDEGSALPNAIAGYEILREIHRGGQGVVYQAIQQATRRYVAVKVMKEGPFAGPQDVARFEREVHILGQLNHPNIVTIHDSGTAQGSFYYVMDYIAGEPLDDYAAVQRLPADAFLRLFTKICDALHAAHLLGIIHRDCKPSNIRVDGNGEPHILDFGLAKTTVDSALDSEVMTITGQFIGSLPWASPEQAEGRPDRIDIRTDVYSLGVILYQILTGGFPYKVAGNMREVLDNIVRVEPPKPSSIRRTINNEIETIILKCLQKEPARRYQSAGELARDIRHYLAGEPIEAKRDSHWYVTRKLLGRHKVGVAVVVGFAVLAVALLALGIRAQTAAMRAEHEAEKARGVGQIVDFATALADPEEYIKGIEQTPERLDRAGSVIDEMLPRHAELRASLHARFGGIYRRGQKYDAAEKHLRRALEDLAQVSGDHRAQQADILHDLGAVTILRGNAAEAIPLYLQSANLRIDVHGSKSPKVAESLNHLAKCYEDLTFFDVAERLYLDALDMRRELPDVEQREVARSLNNVAVFYRDRGKYEEALDYFGQAAAAFEQAHGRRSRDLAKVWGSLGKLYLDVGRCAEAKSFLTDASDLMLELMGPGELSLANVKHQLARLHLFCEPRDTNAAKQLVRDELELRRARQPGHHADIGEAMLLQSEVAAAERDVAAAEQSLEEARSILASHVDEARARLRVPWQVNAAPQVTLGESPSPPFRDELCAVYGKLGGTEAAFCRTVSGGISGEAAAAKRSPVGGGRTTPP